MAATMEAPRPQGRRQVLLAEDNEMTAQLVELMLRNSDHQLDVVLSGSDAIAAASEKHYDVVLMDYHLPDQTGLAAAREIRRQLREQTRIVAITSDLNSLAHDDTWDSVVDAVLPKPIGRPDLMAAIEQIRPLAGQLHDAHARADSNLEADLRPSVLLLPEGGYGDWLPRDVRAAGPNDEAPDIVVLTQTAAIRDLGDYLDPVRRLYTPVIDMTGMHGDMADISVGMVSADALCDAIAGARKILKSVTATRTGKFDPTRLEDALLLSLFARDRPLTPAFDADCPDALRFPRDALTGPLRPVAERLADAGLVERTFFDRIHTCPNCHSSRLNVREECLRCRSPHLDKMTVGHHFSCSHHMFEGVSALGAEVVCLKCSQATGRANDENDTLGTIIHCHSCSHEAGSSAVGYRCLDCAVHHDSEEVSFRDWHSYRLSARGHSAVTSGTFSLASGAELEDDVVGFVHALLTEHCRMNAGLAPFTVLRLTLEGVEVLQRDHGLRACRQTVTLFERALRETLRPDHQTLRKGDCYYVLLANSTVAEVEAGLPYLMQRTTGHLQLDPGARVEICSPGDFAALSAEVLTV